MIYDVAQGKWETLLDVSGAFNQLRVRDGKERMTAFYTPLDLFESLVMPMGMRNAGPWMQAFMVAMFEGNPDALPQQHEIIYHMLDGTDAICNSLQLAAVAQKPTCVAVTDMCYRHVMRNVAENIQVHLLVKEYKDTIVVTQAV